MKLLKMLTKILTRETRSKLMVKITLFSKMKPGPSRKNKPNKISKKSFKKKLKTLNSYKNLYKSKEIKTNYPPILNKLLNTLSPKSKNIQKLSRNTLMII
jgi:hypothetical protein